MNQGSTEERGNKDAVVDMRSGRRFVALAGLAVAAGYLVYRLFFLFAPFIWAQNKDITQVELTPWISKCADQEGIEGYALYCSMFALVFLVLLGSRHLSLLASREYFRWCVGLSVVLGVAFVFEVGFHPPIVENLAPTPTRALVVLGLLIFANLLLLLNRWGSRWVLGVLALVGFPLCFVAVHPIQLFDYSFVFAPALRLVHGASLKEIYLQYDLLLSLIAYPWIALGADINRFQVVGQFSYYLLLLALPLFARSYFADRRLYLFLFLALLSVRILSASYDVVLCFQITPLRLDLWFILVLLIFFKDVRHWSVGLALGLLIVVHKSFGLIYTAAYLQLVVTLALFGDWDNGQGKLLATATKGMVGRLLAVAISQSRNLLLICLSLVVSVLLFGELLPKSLALYQAIGIGFMRIATTSFYWYIAIVLGLTYSILVINRANGRVSQPYFATGLFVIYAAIGNSLYFFGRSHENNILNVSAVLIFVVFLLLDNIALYFSQETAKKWLIAPLLVVATIAYSYGDMIGNRLVAKVASLEQGRWIQPPEVPPEVIIRRLEIVKSQVGDNQKLYFLSADDFLYCFYGGYAPVGYFNPCASWISSPEMLSFLQHLLDDGYIILVDNSVMLREVGPHFTDRKLEQGEGYVLIR